MLEVVLGAVLVEKVDLVEMVVLAAVAMAAVAMAAVATAEMAAAPVLRQGAKATEAGEGEREVAVVEAAVLELPLCTIR